MTGLRLREFCFQMGERRKREEMNSRKRGKSDTPLHLMASAVALFASLCPSVSYFPLCSCAAPPFPSMSLTLYFSLHFSCCVSVTEGDAWPFPSAVWMKRLTLRSRAQRERWLKARPFPLHVCMRARVKCVFQCTCACELACAQCKSLEEKNFPYSTLPCDIPQHEYSVRVGSCCHLRH